MEAAEARASPDIGLPLTRAGPGPGSQAHEHCARAAEIDPEFCDVDNALAFVYVAEGDVGGAITHFQASLECVYTNVGPYKMLLQLYDLLDRRSPQNATLYEQMASTQSVVGNPLYAATLLREAVALHVRGGDANRALASARRGAEELQRAVTESSAIGEERSQPMAT